MALCLLLTFSAGAWAAKTPAPGEGSSCAGAMAANPALPWSFIIWDDVPAEIHAQLESIAAVGFGSLQALAPPGDHLFHWTGPREKPQQKKEVVFVFTRYATIASSAVGYDLSPDGDAGTLMMGEPGNMTLYVFLFVDRLFYDFGGRERPDSFTRFLVAMAHETFGNVQHFLELDIASVGPLPDDAFRFRIEIRAFEAGVRFIEGFQALLRRRRMPGGNIPEDMAAALVREKQGLAVWRQRLEALTTRATPTSGSSH